MTVIADRDRLLEMAIEHVLSKLGAALDYELAVHTRSTLDEVRWALLRMQVRGTARPYQEKGYVVWQLTRGHTFSWERG